MIEVLVAILVLAVGVIGATRMQLAAGRTTKQSSIQTTALQLAADMADKIRSNDLSTMGALGNPLLDVDYNSEIQGEPQPPKKLCYKTSCTETEFADFDLYEWLKRIKTELPGGRARICQDAHPWDDGSRSLAWACTPARAGEAASLVIKVGWQSKNPDGSLEKNGDNGVPPTVALTVKPYSE